MGIFDSTKTLVIPLMKHIGLDHEKMNMLFNCFEKESPKFQKDSIAEICYGAKEKKIRASKEMLNWMLHNLKSLKLISNYGTKNQESDTCKKRKLLFSGDLSVLHEAITLVRDIDEKTANKWYIFEGKTSPDIYLTTEHSVFIGEAKRTERNITTKTLWMDNRDQLIRHIDSVLDQEKAIYSFYILERNKFNKYYQESMKKYTNKSYFESNLKHRTDEKIDRAFNSYLGFLFWEDLAEKFKITFPEKV